MWSAKPDRVAAIVLAATVLGRCAPVPQSGLTPIRFEVTDLQRPTGAAPVVAQDGATIDLPLDFSINVKILDNVMPGASNLRVTATSYVSDCNGMPIREAYRSKVLQYPDSVTSVPATNGLVQSWPVSTATLVALAGCPNPTQPWYPSGNPVAGSLQLNADELQSNGARGSAHVTFRIGQPQTVQ
jgi:hypothetical protein